MTRARKLSERPSATAKQVGGRLCLDFVNTVGGRNAHPARHQTGPGGVILRDDRLNDYFDLLAWGQRAGLLSEAEARALVREAEQRAKEAADVLARAVALREAIYRVCIAGMKEEPPRSADIESLNRELAAARSHERLVAGDGQFVWEWADDRKALDRMLWPVADSAAEFLTAGDLTRLRECGGEDCGWLFEDTSRNRSRQWCDMQDCGNLAKVRRFRQRQQKA
ncbi:MAG TPA: ABATE domain-containing protein [Blastocatellia bacterium]|nr:ABATE domain-containing protein [Blastocatellia bacterium]